MKTTEQPARVVSTLADKIAGAMPTLDAAGRRIALALYKLLAKGSPTTIVDLSRELNLAEDSVREQLGEWPGVYYDEKGDIIGFWGLALKDMPHRFKVNGRGLYTWCAWDGLFIPGLLGSTADVETTCPVTGETIRLKIGPAGIESSSHPDARVSFLSPEAPFDAKVVMTFCHFVLLFSSEEAGNRWVADHPGTFLLTLDEAHEIGQRTNRDVFGVPAAVAT